MEDQTAILANAMHQDPFGMAMRGYDRRQVDEYVARTRTQLRDLEGRVAHALREVEQSRRELAAARDQQSSNRPAHEEVSERLSQILRLAAEEAEQERTKAEADITQMRETAEQEIGTLVQDAREEAEEILAAARQEADRVRNHAGEESQRLLDSSRGESEQVLAEATEHAERLRRQAEHRASVVNGVLNDRLAALTDAHGLAVRRLAEIQDTLADLLRGETEAGPLASAASFGDQAETGEATAAAQPGPDPALAAADEAVTEPAAEVVAAEVAEVTATDPIATDPTGTDPTGTDPTGTDPTATQRAELDDADEEDLLEAEPVVADQAERVIDLRTVESANAPRH